MLPACWQTAAGACYLRSCQSCAVVCLPLDHAGVPPATCSDPSNTDYFDASVKATAGSCDGQSDLLSGLVSPSAAWRTDASKAITATMIKLGMLSHMAYTTKQADNGVQTWSQCLGVTTANYRQIDADGAQVHVYWSDSDIVLAYRGSDGNEPNDWATNIQAALTAFTHNNAEGKTTFQVHSGFWTATQLLNEPIKKLLAEIGANAGSRHKLWFTGVCAAAARARVCCRLCASLGSRPVTVCTEHALRRLLVLRRPLTGSGAGNSG